QIGFSVAQRGEQIQQHPAPEIVADEVIRAVAAKYDKLIISLALGSLLQAPDRLIPIGDPRRHGIGLDEVVCEHRQQIFTFLKAAKINRDFDYVLNRQRSVQTVPKIIEP